jgi:hypothetical protein
VVNVPERKRLQHPQDAGNPRGRSFVNALTKKLTEEIGPRWSGWHYDVAVPGAALWAMTEEDADGRWVVTGIVLLAEAVTADMLRKVPIEAIENSTNLGVRLEDAEGSTVLAHDRAHTELAKLPRLERGDLESEEFSRLVAEHYRVWARYVPHPAAAMAAQADVKPPTMHTWIREARLRGFLPPAKRGKAR